MAGNNGGKKKKGKSQSGKANPAGIFASSERKDRVGRILAIVLIAAMVGFTFITAGLFLLD